VGIISHISKDFLNRLFKVNNLFNFKKSFIVLSSKHLDTFFLMDLFPITSVQKFIENLKLIFSNFKIFFFLCSWFSNILDLLHFLFLFHFLDIFFNLLS